MDLHDFVFAAVVLLAVTAVAVALFKRIGLGSVLGFLAAGLLVGPSGFAITSRTNELREVAELGVVFLLFVIGLELQPRKLWGMRRNVFGLGTLQVVVSAALLTGLMQLVLPHAWRLDLMVGLGLALSSTAFVLQLLAERGDTASVHGKVSFSILLLQDVAVVPLLAIFPLLAEAAQEHTTAGFAGHVVKAVALLAVLLVSGRYLLPWALGRVARDRNMEGFTLLTFLSVIGAAWLMEEAGLSMALGAFLMGLLLSESVYRHQIEAIVEPYKSALLGLFFLSVGMSIDVTLLRSSASELAVFVAAVIVIKCAVILLLVRAFGSSWLTSVRVALLMAQAGEFGFVLFGYALSVGGLEPLIFNKLALVISISMALTPLLVRLSDVIARRIEDRAAPGGELEIPADSFDRHVIVGGFGRVGKTVCRMLRAAKIPYLAFSNNARTVEEGRRAGHPVYYGDIGLPETLRAGGCGRAAMLVVAVDTPAAAERAVAAARDFHPGLVVVARARDFEQADRLRELGATHVEHDVVGTSLSLGEQMLRDIGVPADDVDSLIDQFRKDNYALLRRQD